MMKISDKSIEFLQALEGIEPKSVNVDGYHAYFDSIGKVWTIAWGITVYPNGERVKEGDVIDSGEANLIFKNVVKKFENPFNAMIDKHKIRLTQNEYDALIIFVYNVGINNFRLSTLFKKLCAGNKDSTELLRWNKAGQKVVEGLTNRRLSEKRLFDAGEYFVFYNGECKEWN